MTWDDDWEIPEDAAIRAAHPTRSGRHTEYAEAMRMVGAKHSKGALVELVSWLLVRVADARAEGRREGLEAAAQAAWDAYDLNSTDAHETYLNIDRAIRALAKETP